tara:strand:+ start:268 stop:510 length:243 start_codon:yes stop_codon:yes gene_type:complete
MDRLNPNESAEPERLNPIALTIDEAASIARLSRSTIYVALRDGSLTARKLGRRTIICVDDLRQFLDTLPAFKCKRLGGED